MLLLASTYKNDLSIESIYMKSQGRNWVIDLNLRYNIEFYLLILIGNGRAYVKGVNMEWSHPYTAVV